MAIQFEENLIGTGEKFTDVVVHGVCSRKVMCGVCQLIDRLYHSRLGLSPSREVKLSVNLMTTQEQ